MAGGLSDQDKRPSKDDKVTKFADLVKKQVYEINKCKHKKKAESYVRTCQIRVLFFGKFQVV